MSEKVKKNWRRRNRVYIVAIVLAFVMTMFVAPEVCDDNSMEPTISKGQCICVIKDSYSAKRGIPEINTVVVLEKVYSKKFAKDNIIGRIVGLPGDTIEIKDGKLYRNDKEYPVNGSSDCSGKYKVKLDKDSVFLLCDNREAKKYVDSRTIGPVPMKEIKGNAGLVIWPINKIGRIN